jgi:hypothetical protein
MNNFDEYLRQGEPNKAEKAKVWKMAIGLQVDGLKPSEYLFFENFLPGQNHILINREIHVHYIDRVNTQNDPVKEANDLVNDLVKSNILHCIKQNPKAKYIEIANETGYSVSTIKRHIQELKKRGLLERIGSEKTGYWKIIE